jgi:hypothetical protein
VGDTEMTHASREWGRRVFVRCRSHGFDNDGVIHASRGLRSIATRLRQPERDARSQRYACDESFRRVLHSFIKGLGMPRKSPRLIASKELHHGNETVDAGDRRRDRGPLRCHRCGGEAGVGFSLKKMVRSAAARS